jgi:hypothetical protein
MTMPLPKLFQTMTESGIRLAVEGGRLHVDALASALTPEIRAALAFHRDTIVQALGLTTAEAKPPIENSAKPVEEVREPNDVQLANTTQDSGWREAEAKALVEEAIRIRDAWPYKQDAAMFQRQGDLADRIDERWLARDLTGLSEAVAEFINLFQRAPPAPRTIAIDPIDSQWFAEGECPGCDMCRASGKEPEPRPHERLDVVWLRITGKPWPYGSLSWKRIEARSLGDTSSPGGAAAPS